MSSPSNIDSTTRSARVYANARRHSALVATLKWLLPTSAALAAVFAVGYVWLSRVETAPQVGIDVLGSAIQNGKLVMSNPTVTGFTSDNRPYNFVAERAVQDIGDQSRVEMETLRASFELSGGESASLKSDTGLFDRSTNTLNLTGPSIFTTSDGITARFSQAQINMDTGHLQTDYPVEIEQPGTKINAGRMTISESGQHVVFETNVRLVLQPDAMREMAQGGSASSQESDTN